MSTHKRLFLFAAFDPQNIIDDALIHYVSALSKHGDIIVCIDSDCKKTETNKLQKHTIHTISERHGEYDFGSYKRAFQYARDKNILKNYDFIYLVNDSVFGPMFDIKNTLDKIENSDSDATGMVVAKHKTHSYMESWFVRLNKKIFMSKWFDKFISSVTHEEYKFIITVKYEHGLTNIIKKHNCSWSGIYTYYGRKTYNNPKSLFKSGCPFIKKASFTRHNGSIGNQIKYVLKHSDLTAKNSVIKSAERIYGKQYIQWLLTYNPVKIILRKTTYVIQKLKNGTK